MLEHAASSLNESPVFRLEIHPSDYVLSCSSIGHPRQALLLSAFLFAVEVGRKASEVACCANFNTNYGEGEISNLHRKDMPRLGRARLMFRRRYIVTWTKCDTGRILLELTSGHFSWNRNYY